MAILFRAWGMRAIVSSGRSNQRECGLSQDPHPSPLPEREREQEKFVLFPYSLGSLTPTAPCGRSDALILSKWGWGMKGISYPELTLINGWQETLC